LDLDSLEVLQAMATARQPLAIPMIERIALVPAEEPIRDLVERGLVQTVPAGEGPRGQEGATRYAVAAGAFQDAALASVPDPEGLARRVEAALGRPPEERRATSDAEEGWVGRLGYAMGLRDEGRWEEAHFALSQLLLEAERLGEPTLLARATVGLGSVEWGLGRPAEAEVSLRRALALAPDDLQVRGNASNALGILEVQAGRPLAALALFDQATLAFQRAHLPAREVASWLNLAEARSMVGRLAGALDASERAVHLSRALGQAPLECASLRHKGLVLLDVGLAEEAGRVLADASALAHAAELPAERLAAHVLRAQASLDLDPGTRTAAAVAVDRLLRSVLDTSIPDPEGHRGLAWGILARAAAVLGDARLFQRSVDQTSNVEIEKISPTWIRIQLQLTRAFWTAGRRTRAAEIAKKAHANAEEQGFLLLAYEAQRLVARFMGTTPQPPGDLGEGLSQRALAALEKKPSFP
jgi:tetratricopeptide (TPR) repeat protein